MAFARQARTHHFVDTAAEGAEYAIRSTQDAANKALDSVADTVDHLRGRSSPALERARDQAAAYAQRSLDNMRNVSSRMRETAQQASHQTVGYIRDEPVKTVLIAAAAGAVLMGLAYLFRRSEQPRRH